MYARRGQALSLPLASWCRWLAAAPTNPVMEKLHQVEDGTPRHDSILVADQAVVVGPLVFVPPDARVRFLA